MKPTYRMIFGRGYVLAPNPCQTDIRALPYWRRQADRLFAASDATIVSLVNRGHSNQTRYTPESGEIMMVPATGGRWGKSSMYRWGKGVTRRVR